MSDRIDYLWECHNKEDLKSFCRTVIEDFELYERNMDININEMTEDKVVEILYVALAMYVFGTAVHKNKGLNNDIKNNINYILNQYHSGDDIDE